MILKPTAVDTIIQSSMVELFSTHGLSIAPRHRRQVQNNVPDGDIFGMIGFDGIGIGGHLLLAVTPDLFKLAASGRAKNTTFADWTRELTNQVMGLIKNRLVQFQVLLRTHIPTVISRAALERLQQRGVTEVLYTFGALRGDVSIAVDVSLTRVTLQYSNASLLLDDDVTLFE
jgi:hypothetical protein